MNIQHCWETYQKAELLLAEGHWPEAYHLFDNVLHYIPEHINTSVYQDDIEPCQFVALVSTLRDTSIAQSKVLMRMGRQQCAFHVMNQCYCQLQFISIEDSPLVIKTLSIINKYSEDMVSHISEFCASQRSAQWMIELETLQRSHHYFSQIKSASGKQTVRDVLN
ncbi:hypothetical protein KP803_10635 [Vibrio sp. ZSDE26]|uniref:Uncharacterized protein n=1 Tax=Vibrio amylolyticus TaxID=2847292 RepID=A0A9X1XIU5_9VIBR|nr:hypothetical protein [Vibrio amylolyticus]MCK6263729.1 hypothetical protein [Vibrio amylolyticus]